MGQAVQYQTLEWRRTEIQNDKGAGGDRKMVVGKSVISSNKEELMDE